MKKNINILSWNIHHGGNKKYLDSIIESIYEKKADISILTEFRENNNAIIIKDFFTQKGFKCITSKPEGNDNGILLITKLNIEVNNYNGDNNDIPTQRWIEINVLNYNFNILAIHIPGGKDKYDKKTFWNEVQRFSLNNSDNNAIIIGDYNTGFKYDSQGTPFIHGNFMYNLIENGWIDVWNKLNKNIEFSWYSNKGNGFRIDHIFTTKVFVSKILKSYFSHAEREKKYSDHSILLIELEL